MHHLAFYRGRGNALDALIRVATRSQFSHVELVAELRAGAEIFHGRAISSSGRDGGVRSKDVRFFPRRWEFVAVPWAPHNAFDRASLASGAGYDFLGALGVPFSFANLGSRKRWFCSELCAHALGLSEPHRYSPGSLHRVVTEMGMAFELGRSVAAGEAPEEIEQWK